MTITTTTAEVSYTPSASANEVFTINFVFEASSEIYVTVTDSDDAVTTQTEGVDYSVSGGAGGLGSVTWIGTSPDATNTVTIYRWVDPKQETDYAESGPFPAESHEDALDKLTKLVQQLLDRLGGSTFANVARKFLGRAAASTQWDAESKRITNVTDPTSAQDAATRGYVNTQISGSTTGLPAVDGGGGDTLKALTVSGTSIDWRGWTVPEPAVGEVGNRLEATSAAELGWSWLADHAIYNAILNGDFSIGQRGTSFTGATLPVNDDGTYLFDRWAFLVDESVPADDLVDSIQVTTASVVPEGSYSAILLQATTNIGTPSEKFGIIQVLENRETRRLWQNDGTGTATLSFKAKTTSLQVENLRATVLAWTSTADSVTLDVVSAWNLEDADPTWATNWDYADSSVTEETNRALTNAWQTFSTTYTLDGVGVTNLAVIIWVDDTDVAANDGFWISDVQLVPGSRVAPVIRRNAAEELALCQRFYEQSYNEGVAPGTVTAVGQEMVRNDETATISNSVDFRVSKRSTPTVVLYSPDSGTAGKWFELAGADFTVTAATKAQRGFTVTGTSAVANKQITGHWTADAEL